MNSDYNWGVNNHNFSRVTFTDPSYCFKFSDKCYMTANNENCAAHTKTFITTLLFPVLGKSKW